MVFWYWYGTGTGTGQLVQAAFVGRQRAPCTLLRSTRVRAHSGKAAVHSSRRKWSTLGTECVVSSKTTVPVLVTARSRSTAVARPTNSKDPTTCRILLVVASYLYLYEYIEYTQYGTVDLSCTSSTGGVSVC